MEQDDFEVLPGSTCVKGFLRQYAIFLKLDADGLVESYKARFEPRAEDPSVIRADVTSRRKSPTSTERRKKRSRSHQRGYAFVAFLAIVVIALLAWFGASRGQGAATIGAENISTSTVSTAAPLSTEGDTPATGSTGADATGVSGSGSTGGSVQATVSTAVDEATAIDAGPNDQVTLVVTVTEGTCWLVVREDNASGAEVYAGTLSAGGRQTFEGAKSYWMNVGKPDALTVSVGGKSYTLASPAGAFLVTAAGVERSQ